jgi:hypothetical protein
VELDLPIDRVKDLSDVCLLGRRLRVSDHQVAHDIEVEILLLPPWPSPGATAPRGY